MGNYDKVLSRLRKLRWHPNSRMWSACCPAHDDKHPSLWVYVGKNGGLVARCKSAGCSWDAIVEATRTDKRDWFPEQERRRMPEQQQRGKIVATYQYHDKTGNLLYEVCRIEPGRDGRKKDFSFRRPQPGGSGWIYNLEGVQKTLYRLPELLDERKKSHPVFVVEGEGKVEALRKLGFLATSAPCGAGHWLPEFGEYLTGRRVVILPDNDSVGMIHALYVMGSLMVPGHSAAALWLIKLPGLPDGGDVIDWFASLTSPAHQKAALIQLVKESKRWELKDGEPRTTDGTARLPA